MLIVPLQATPNQTFTIQLAGQSCQIDVYQTRFGLYMDLQLNNLPVVTGVICQNKNRIVRDLYFGFAGDFWFFDTQGDSDPHYTGLGGRYLLQYIEASELPAGVG
jgi:hypothetical protein